MPLTYLRDDRARRLIAQLSGDVTVDDFAGFIATMITRDLWSYGVLYDATAEGVRLLGLDPPLVAMWRELTLQYGPRAPVAFAVASPEQRLLAERYVATADAEGLFRAAVFDNLADAWRWLDALERADK